MRPLAGFLLFVALASGARLSAKELYERPWIEARSPNFVVVSALSEKKTVAAVQDLEDFRQVIALITLARLEERVPTFVYIFPGAVPEIDLEGDIGGYFLPTMRANYAVVRARSGMGLLEVLQHEYTHFLVRNHTGRAYPRWFDEGFAELLSTVRVSSGRFTFGDSSSMRAGWLNNGEWLPYARIIDEEWSQGDISRNQKAMFYAQSWALIHYLNLGPHAASFAMRNLRYLKLMEAGSRPRPAFEEAYGEPVDLLGARVRKYLSNAKYKVGALKTPFPTADVRVRDMASREIAAVLGRLSLIRGKHKESRRFVDIALAAKPDHASSLTIRADLDKFEQRYAEAEPQYERAIALEPDSDLHRLDFGEYYLTRAGAIEDPAERAEFLKFARRQFVQAHKLNPKNPEVLAMYGQSFQFDGEPVEKGIDTLELANQLLPSDPNIRMLLARGYLAVDRPKDATPLLKSVLAWSHGAGAEAVRKLLAEIEGKAPAQPAPAPAGIE